MFPIISDASFYMAAIPAVILMGFAKGGFAGLGLLSMSLLSTVVSPVKAAAIMLPILIVQDAVSVWSYRKTFDKRLLVIMLPGSILGIVFGWLVAAYVSEGAVRLIVGAISVIFVGMFWRRRTTLAQSAEVDGHQTSRRVLGRDCRLYELRRACRAGLRFRSMSCRSG